MGDAPDINKLHWEYFDYFSNESMTYKFAGWPSRGSTPVLTGTDVEELKVVIAAMYRLNSEIFK